MIWIVTSYLIGFSFYQLFGIPNNTNWAIFYDSLFNCSFIAICINRFIYGNYRHIWFIFGLMFVIFFLIDLTFINSPFDFYEANSCMGKPYYLLPLLFILLLIGLIIYKKWGNIKIGR